jgi:hypothetical protein
MLLQFPGVLIRHYEVCELASVVFSILSRALKSHACLLFFPHASDGSNFVDYKQLADQNSTLIYFHHVPTEQWNTQKLMKR